MATHDRAREQQGEQALRQMIREGFPKPPHRPRVSRVTHEAAARLPRQSLDQTRDDLRNAAIRIVNDYVASGPRVNDPPVDLLPFLKLEEVLEVASELARERLEHDGRMLADERISPLTPGAFYKAFSDLQVASRGGTITAFRRLITLELTGDPLLTNSDVYIALGAALHSAGHPWSEVVRLGVEAEYRRWVETPALTLMNALALHAGDREVCEWAKAVDDRQLDELVKIYSALMTLYGIDLRPGRTVRQFSVAVSDMIAGMALASRFNPSYRDTIIDADVDGSGAKPWHLCAFSAWAIYQSFVEPRVNPG